MPKTRFTVTGRGPFPMDMLRYDSAWPEQTEDARAIEQSFAPEFEVPWRVTLLTDQRGAPTVGRWASFCTKVVEIN